MDQHSNCPVYIADMGVITAIGDRPDQVYFTAKAGISAYAVADYLTHDHKSMILASVPEDALPPLKGRLRLSGKLKYRDQRLLRMSQAALGDAMKKYAGAEPVPLILSVPEQYSGFDNSLNSHFVEYLRQQSDLPIDADNSRFVYTGRAGVIEALQLATRYLYEENHSHVLIGGVDSCHNSDYLAFLDTDSRVKAHRPQPATAEDCFSPGEAAVFFLLTRQPGQALHTKRHRIRLEPPGFGHEAGHLYSEDSFKAEGLDHAVKQALHNRQDKDQPVHLIYNSLNGEHHWAKEFGVALSRNQQYFSEQPVIEHPAENYGDIGAATAAGLILMAHSQLLLETPGCCLVCSSADQGFRAAVCLTTENIAA